MVYVWRKNEKCEQPSLLAFFDTETNEIPHDTDPRCTRLFFRLGVIRAGSWDGTAFNGVEERYLSRPHQFWDCLYEHSRPKRVLWAFAHNILFDLWVLGLPELVERGEFKLTLPGGATTNTKGRKVGSERGFLGQCSIDHGATIIKGVYRGRRINFIDSANYFRGSLGGIGTSIGLAKMAMPGGEDSEKAWFAYCSRDVEIVEASVCGLMREWRANDLGNWQPTIASLAFSAYRHRFMSRPIVCHGDEDVSAIEHDAYFDGRTTPYYVGRIAGSGSLYAVDAGAVDMGTKPRPVGPVWHVDINSLYPSVMRANPYPVEAVSGSGGRPIIWEPPSVEWLAEQLETYLCVAICAIDTPLDLYPIKSPEGTRYPVGRFWTTLCTPEVKLALSGGHLAKCQAVILYHGHDIFTPWVDYWWRRKQDADGSNNLVRRECCKLLLNSISGKFAQRERHWKNTLRFPAERNWWAWPAHDSHRGGPVSLRSIGSTVQILDDSGYAPHALVATSAHINSYARVRMINDRLRLPEKSCLYSANDGLLLTNAGHECLRESSRVGTGRLGDYRDVGVYEQVSIYGPRDYQCDGAVHKAGLPKDRQQLAERRWAVKRFEGAAGQIARPPDGSIHLYADVVSGSEHHWGQTAGKSGWLQPIRLAQW